MYIYKTAHIEKCASRKMRTQKNMNFFQKNMKNMNLENFLAILFYISFLPCPKTFLIKKKHVERKAFGSE